MSVLTRFLAWVIVAPLVAYAIGSFIHEYTHYVVGRLRSPHVTVDYDGYILPTSLTFDVPYAFTPGWIRLTALAPLVWLPLDLLAWDMTIADPSFGSILVSMTLLTAGAPSPPDLFAGLYPREYQARGARGYEFTNKKIAIELYHRFRGNTTTGK